MLITFPDASSEAMAACVYLRSDNAVNLLMAKGKLPPLDSKVTVPKLELNAMTLGMRLTNSVISQLSSTVTISRVLILSDSEIALNWIKSTPRHDVGPFVKNRVTEVRKIMTSLEKSGYQIQFGHISSEWNPADCATRGLDKQSLSNHFWWNGPSFLRNSSETWDKTYKTVTIEKAIGDDLDPITISTSSVTNATSLAPSWDKDLFHRRPIRNMSVVRRIVAYVCCFIRVLAQRVNVTRISRMKLSRLLRIGFNIDSNSISVLRWPLRVRYW
ncbi:hypothetical protein RB195_024964 [Necator americanus]|uniref:RNase H type-1 domain-containing protein n=1 Tax=Necator americanus TaxID=51031 RepID=A0ABR1EQC9_NECAM